MGDLREYRAKRDPARTPEPVPDGPAMPGSHGHEPVFVIHEHRARSLHWDLRLEHDGVLACWAIPLGIPPHSTQDRTAIRTEDHPLEYATFEGVIPKGEYGAGAMAVFDHGVHKPVLWTDHEVKVELSGARVKGAYALFHTGPEPGAWRIHLERGQDLAGWAPVPVGLEPMLAAAGPVPTGPGWAAEFKWDGWRALARVEGGRVRLRSRNGLDVTDAFPEIKALGRQAGSTSMLLDGEVVATRAGKISFSALQARGGTGGVRGTEPGKARAARLAAADPVSYLIFDLLHLDGTSLLALPYAERRALLTTLELAGPAWQTPPSFADVPAETVLAAAVEQDLEGIVVKRLDSVYRPGARSADWVKVKTSRTQTVVIGGYTPLRSGTASRPAAIGALLIGVVDETGALRYAGRVGSGLSDAARHGLFDALSTAARPDKPFADAVPRTDAGTAVWTEPVLVAEVSFAEWTPGGRLRHPVFKGVRLDKSPTEARREPQI